MPGQPYVAKLPDGRYFAVELPEGSTQTDPLTGELLLHAPAIHLLDRLRTLLTPLTVRITPQRLRILRESLGFSPQGLAKEMNCAEQTVTAWEMGKTKPDSAQVGALEKLRLQAVQRGILLPERSLAS